MEEQEQQGKSEKEGEGPPQATQSRLEPQLNLGVGETLGRAVVEAWAPLVPQEAEPEGLSDAGRAPGRTVSRRSHPVPVWCPLPRAHRELAPSAALLFVGCVINGG